MLNMFSRIIAVISFGILLGGCGPEQRRERPPDIILITIDTLRADRLSAYGYEKKITPNFDHLAESGVVFEHAVATAGLTWPSHTSMLTGLYPRYHGVRRNGHVLGDDVPVVTEVLAKSGYATASFVSYKGLHFRGGLHRGFQTASDREMARGKKGGIRDGAETTRMALDWLERQSEPETPLFLWLHLFEPHGPYELTEYARRWMVESGYEGFLRDGASSEVLRNAIDRITSSPQEVRALNMLYDGEVRLADEYVGRLLDALEASGRLKNAVVILAADHGQALGENGKMGHGPTLREDVLHIPLIIRDFRVDHNQRRVGETVSTVDFAPTIAELALGTTLPNVHGRSLVPLIAAGGDSWPQREVFAEIELKKDLARAPAWYDHESVAIYVGGLKYVTQHGHTTVYDPRGPASSERPLASPEPSDAFAAYLESVRTEYLAGEIEPVEAELSKEEIETLRSLGYIQ